MDCYPNITLSREKRTKVLLKAGAGPERLLGALLDNFFSKEVLAGSSALGSTDHPALDCTIIAALKEFTLRMCRKADGLPCLKDKDFNRIINAKCGTARRSLKPKCNQ